MGSLPSGCVYVVMADFDGDRDMDIVFGREGLEPMLLFTNRLRAVNAGTTVRVGSAWPVQISGRAGFASGPQVAVPYADTRMSPVPVRLPWGTVFLGGYIQFPPVLVPHPTGTATAQLGIPNASHLIGQAAYVQALIVHDAASFGLTNLGSSRIVP